MNTEQWLIYTLYKVPHLYLQDRLARQVWFVVYYYGATMDHLDYDQRFLFSSLSDLKILQDWTGWRMITANLAGGLGSSHGSRQHSLPGSRRGSNNHGLTEVIIIVIYIISYHIISYHTYHHHHSNIT